ncbi:MAG: hypothetical protein B6I24_06735 [Bacteroidetes bacterium 4572_128]|nr:MAG: hypothetical protein B6I24_06735 [Bacteroidetes bacterium 4572_128]
MNTNMLFFNKKIFYFFIILFTVSCINEKKDKSSNGEDNIVDEEAEKKDTILAYTKYDLPLPVNLYVFLKGKNLAFFPELLVPIEKERNYVSNTRKAINMGFYSSDLGYCSTFEQTQKTIDYYVVLKRMAESFGIGEGYNEDFIGRVEKNKNNIDSIYNLSTDAYWKFCNKLESDGKVNVLPFVVVGSWLESMHLITNVPEEKKLRKEIFKKVAEQEEALNNIIKYLYKVMLDSNAFEAIDDIQVLIKQLKNIQSIYKKIYKYEGERLLKKDDFKAIKVEIMTIREEYKNIN